VTNLNMPLTNASACDVAAFLACLPSVINLTLRYRSQYQLIYHRLRDGYLRLPYTTLWAV